MDLKVISELIRMMSDSKLSSLEVESKDIRIKLEKNSDGAKIENRELVTRVEGKDLLEKTEERYEDKVQSLYENQHNDRAMEKAMDFSTSENFKVVKSPIVGTFYRAASPENAPFAEVGKRVKKGDTLCIVEAMKLMNEIESEYDGEIVEILVENGAMVEYGQPLFKLK